MKKIFLFAFCLLPSAFCLAQDIHFAQLSETPLLLNPALTGEYDGFYRGILNYRNQWLSMGKPYSTFMGSFDTPIEMKRREGGYIGTGINFFSDRAGDSHFGTTQGNLSVSAILPVNEKSKLSAGLQFGFSQHSLNLSSIQWPNQYNGQNYDPNITPNEPYNRNFSFFDLGAGGNYEVITNNGTFTGKEITKFDLGAAFFHATMPIQKFHSGAKETLYGKLIAHTSLRHDFPGTVLGIVPSVVFMMQGPASELNIGALIRYKVNQGTKVTGFYSQSAIAAGLQYRFKDAISPQFYLELADFGIGISYDVNVSSYTKNQKSTGAFEISIKYANMKGALRKGMK